MTALEVIEENLELALAVLQGQIQDVASDDYWSGYYDACRHARNAIENEREDALSYPRSATGEDDRS